MEKAEDVEESHLTSELRSTLSLSLDAHNFRSMLILSLDAHKLSLSAHSLARSQASVKAGSGSSAVQRSSNGTMPNTPGSGSSAARLGATPTHFSLGTPTPLSDLPTTTMKTTTKSPAKAMLDDDSSGDEGLEEVR